MDRNNLRQIFDHYIERFDEINGEKSDEYYKWQIAYDFRRLMDEALDANDEVFSEKLLAVKSCTVNLIDSFTTPFYGLCRFAKAEPEEVRGMFQDLLHDEEVPVQVRVDSFIESSHALRDKYYNGSYLYSDDAHSVTGYLFLYDPDSYYFFKAGSAGKFADCIKFPESWGSGKSLNLDVFNKMCDQVIEEINAYPPLLEADAKRFDGRFDNHKYGSGMHPDVKKHILLFDLIYCCSAKNLFDGIKFDKRSFSKANKEFLLKQQKAIQINEQLEQVQKQVDSLEEIKEKLAAALVPGTHVTNSKLGIGTVTESDGRKITVDFESRSATYIIINAFSQGFLTCEDPAVTKMLEDNYELLIKSEDIFKEYYELNTKMQSFEAYLPE